jgi:phage/plasmid-associated DNA primase
VTIPEAERDTDLPTKLGAELPGILAWAVRGCLEWQRLGLAEPETVKRATERYREENDVLGEFFRQAAAFEPNATIARRSLREAYETFCAESDSDPFDAKQLATRLRERGVSDASLREGKRVVRGWRGVRLMTDAERSAATTWIDRSHVGTCNHQKRDDDDRPVASAQLEAKAKAVPTGDYVATCARRSTRNQSVTKRGASPKSDAGPRNVQSLVRS